MKRKRNIRFKRVLYYRLYNADVKALKRKFGCRVVALVDKYTKEKQISTYTFPLELSNWFDKLNKGLQGRLTSHIAQRTVGML